MRIEKRCDKLSKTVEKEEYRLLLLHRELLTVRQQQAMFREWAFEVRALQKVGAHMCVKQGGTAGV